MGKIVNSTFVSLDGVINHMPAWHFDYTDDEEYNQINEELLLAAEALLLGRKTYEIYAGVWPGSAGTLADRINSMRKYVASTTLDDAVWNNTRVISRDLVGTVAKLRSEPGDILMHGFGSVAHTLLQHGLLDVLHLWVHPHFAGVGTIDDTLVREGTNTGMRLLGTRSLGSGIVILTYQAPS
jgi:dihydrofolate reductase